MSAATVHTHVTKQPKHICTHASKVSSARRGTRSDLNTRPIEIRASHGKNSGSHQSVQFPEHGLSSDDDALVGSSSVKEKTHLAAARHPGPAAVKLKGHLNYAGPLRIRRQPDLPAQ
jgi:hypothetical protein